jgi:hypothetical protein
LSAQETWSIPFSKSKLRLLIAAHDSVSTSGHKNISQARKVVVSQKSSDTASVNLMITIHIFQQKHHCLSLLYR